MKRAVQVVRGGGKSAVSEVRDRDWELLVKLTNDLPARAKRVGAAECVRWVQTQLRSLLDACGVAADPVKAAAFHYALFDEGWVWNMITEDGAGARARALWLATAERIFVAPTMTAAFKAPPETAAYQPLTETEAHGAADSK